MLITTSMLCRIKIASKYILLICIKIDLINTCIVETKKFTTMQNEDKKLTGLKKSISKGNIKNSAIFGLSKKTTNARPSSAKNSSKQRSSSGKKEYGTKNTNKSRSRDRSKQMKSKEGSQNRKNENDALLTSLKNIHKNSSFAPILDILDSK